MTQIEQIRQEVMTALKTVKPTNAPNIYSRVQTKEGYRWVENEILSMVLETGQAPLMCIPQIESEL